MRKPSYIPIQKNRPVFVGQGGHFRSVVTLSLAEAHLSNIRAKKLGVGKKAKKERGLLHGQIISGTLGLSRKVFTCDTAKDP